ncbi:MAG: ABC transporter ATP-binding protein [Pseudoflavonifractor capillosus]|uniref:ABC transporter ATP-binding protein n=1 Tax=Pseudoflavonifractor capillosus TaxID=106588 RepID=UPI0002D46F85|nr:ABC transporter ATP-binding protein [Pseudoflavonifractor capillosus]MDY4660895.1 ABC transporter ATP-binding protein [Pseudoflavonifractor capillosus]
MDEPILKVKGLCTEFKTVDSRVRAVDGVDLELYPGETLGIVGESGCGKSVTALSIMQLLPKGVGKVVDGQILFDGKDMLKLSTKELLSLHGRDMAMIFQEPMTSLNPVYTIGYQLSEVLRYHMGMNKKDAWQKSIDLLKDVGVSRPEQIVRSYPHELSGGMLQRVMIAMGLSCNPKLLIADEPTTALDVTIQAQILELMGKLKEEYNTAILMITHNMGVVAEVCDRVIVMYAGYVVEMAEVNELFDNPSHPYTQGLLKCIPNIDEDREVLDTIEGTVPPPYAMPKGCRFAPRCPYATPECEANKPELYDIGGGHTCRCFRYKEGNPNA